MKIFKGCIASEVERKQFLISNNRKRCKFMFLIWRGSSKWYFKILFVKLDLLCFF